MSDLHLRIHCRVRVRLDVCAWTFRRLLWGTELRWSERMGTEPLFRPRCPSHVLAKESGQQSGGTPVVVLGYSSYSVHGSPGRFAVRRGLLVVLSVVFAKRVVAERLLQLRHRGLVQENYRLVANPAGPRGWDRQEV